MTALVWFCKQVCSLKSDPWPYWAASAADWQQMLLQQESCQLEQWEGFNTSIMTINQHGVWRKMDVPSQLGPNKLKIETFQQKQQKPELLT